MRIKIERIYVDEEVEKTPLAQRVFMKLPEVPVTVVQSAERFLEDSRDVSLSSGKKALWLTRFKGPLLKPCPATQPDYLCCNYWVINAQTNCPLDCSYCVLQGYLNQPYLTVYVNAEDLKGEIDALIRKYPGRLFRFGTGELTDSLALDPFTEFDRDLIQWFSGKKAILELKTKTDLVAQLPRIAGGNTVLSWSLNPEEIILEEEFRTSTLEERLKSASGAVAKGYRLGFHFDPIIEVPDWEKKYERLVRQLQEAVPEKEVLWISLGALRFPPAFKKVIHERFPHTAITSGEFIPGLDGKMRYFRPIRVRMYRKIHSWLREKWPEVFLYFCMENQTVWNSVMGFAPESNEHLEYLFHESVFRRFPETGMAKPERSFYDKIEF